MTPTTIETPLAPPLFAGPFDGSERAADIIGRVQDFLHGELAELAATRFIDHEHGAPRALLQQVWRRSHQMGFYGMTLPEKMGGLGLSVLDHVLIKEAIYASGSPFAPHVFGELSDPPRVGALARQASPCQMAEFIVHGARQHGAHPGRGRGPAAGPAGHHRKQGRRGR